MTVLLCIVGSAQAQITEEQRKERKEIKKMSQAALKEKSSKLARKEAKKLAKEGWMVAPGALPMEKQLDKSYLMQQEFDDEMFPKFIMGDAMSVAGNYDAAKSQALELAKQNLAGQIQSEVTALIESTVANSQLEEEEAATVTKMVLAAKSIISQKIGRVIPVVELYRTLANKNKEVRVYIAYNAKMAKAAARAAIREELEQEGEELQKKLDKALGW